MFLGGHEMIRLAKNVFAFLFLATVALVLVTWIFMFVGYAVSE